MKGSTEDSGDTWEGFLAQSLGVERLSRGGDIYRNSRIGINQAKWYNRTFQEEERAEDRKTGA